MSENEATKPWDDPAWLGRVAEFARQLGLASEREMLLRQALTHRSLSEEAPYGDNERLEFLGDSVLALLVNDFLFREYPEAAEGELTKLKARYVCEPSLARAATELRLGTLLAMAVSDEAAGGRERPSALSDAFEAVLAAVYLCRGLEGAREFLHRSLIALVDPTEVWDYKSRLQELYQEKKRTTPVYRTLIESGPAHNRIFYSEAVVGEEVVGRGTGKSKKLAEQAAAADALKRFRVPVQQPEERL